MKRKPPGRSVRLSPDAYKAVAHVAQAAKLTIPQATGELIALGIRYAALQAQGEHARAVAATPAGEGNA